MQSTCAVPGGNHLRSNSFRAIFSSRCFVPVGVVVIAIAQGARRAVASPAVKILDAIARQPRSLIWIGALLTLLVVGVIDYVTPWRFSLFMFYAFIIFGVAWARGLRDALPFAVCCLTVSWFANVSTYPFADFRGYVWSAANRAVAFFFVAACGNAVRSYREEAHARVEEMARTRRLEREILRTGESEQRRIGQDLHDGVCQNLSAINCATEILKRALEADGAPQAADAEHIQRMLQETIVELRNLAHAISPVNLTAEGLPAAIEGLVATTNQLRQSSVSFYSDEEIGITDPVVAIHLYRIAQEALSNAMKHARASHVAVSLKRAADALTLTISDDGAGLPESATRSTGMGLHTMEYRANLIGATFSADGNESGGVSVTCVLPAPAANGQGRRNALSVLA